ncbi:MAG TPA: NADH-quinone oxidoreductase subunit NuoF [Bacillota bacterium]|nr:NADH-quinone oxidoreductase subunit NuoF [Bacillota bacterium]
MHLYRAHVLVCAGTNCSLKGHRAVREALTGEIVGRGLGGEVKVVETGCFGLCEQGPTIVVYPEGVLYCRVRVEDVPELVGSHLLKGRRVERLMYREPARPVAVQTVPELGYFRKQVRVVLENCGIIDPDSLEEYIGHGGYAALARVLGGEPAAVVAEVKASGLRGRGGAGFPAGLKWEFGARAPGPVKYVVCNADEGEPGTFKDRLILEGDPHRILEGMAICGFATGSRQGYIYIRGEYGLSISRLEHSIRNARELGLLGRNIFDSGFDFDVEVRFGAGAYVCGEETALFESLEGKRGEPRIKPPYPTEVGLFGRPTVINNVETLANIPSIVNRGAAWYRGIGTDACPGTKVFTLTGDIVNEGLIEVPMGITLREVIYDIGGGIPGGRRFKMAQTGGTSGGCLPESLLDVPMDFDRLAAAGSALGSGALLVMDDTHCIVDVTRVFSRFFLHESCGQCAPCREGTLQLHHILERFTTGRGSRDDLRLLGRLAKTLAGASLCPLGQSVPLSVLTTLKHFEPEYLAHIDERACPTGTCRPLAGGVKPAAAGNGRRG